MNRTSLIEITFYWRPGEGFWKYLTVALLWIKVYSVRMEICVLLFTLCLLSVREILNVDVKQIEFTINLDINPVNC